MGISLPTGHFKKKIPPKDFFVQKKSEKIKLAAARLATILAIRWTGNKLFLKGGLTIVIELHKCTLKWLIQMRCGSEGPPTLRHFSHHLLNLKFQFTELSSFLSLKIPRMSTL